MTLFGRIPSKRAVHGAIRDADRLWKRAAKTGARELADVGDRAEDLWDDARAQAVDAWQDAKAQAEERFGAALKSAERSFRKGAVKRWNRAARKPTTALLVLGAAVGIALIVSSLRRPEPDRV